jgi:cell division protein ZapA
MWERFGALKPPPAVRGRLDNHTQGDCGSAGGGMDAKNVVQVQIFGHSYTIRGEAEQDYITSVAAYVDRKMREITEKLPVASLSKVAILASLNIADELFKERAKQDAQQQLMGDQAARLNAVLEDLLQDGASR